MGLRIKNFQEIIKGMADMIWANSKKISDFSVGSVTRTLLEGVSSEIEQYYFNMYKNMLWAIENSIFNSFGFEKVPALAASGNVTITFTNILDYPVFLPSGTRFSTVTKINEEILYFETREDYTILAGSAEADVRVYCLKPGVIGNVFANTIKLMVNPISVVSFVTNKTSFVTGKAEETQAERRQRFNKYIDTLAKATISSIEYGVLEVKGVSGVMVDESEIGVLRVYAHDSNGDLPDSLKNQILENLINYRAGGIPAEVLPIGKTEIDLLLNVTVLSAYNNANYKAQLIDSITAYLNSFQVSKDFLVSDMIKFIMNYDVAIQNVKVLSPTSDINVLSQEIIRARTINVNLIS